MTTDNTAKLIDRAAGSELPDIGGSASPAPDVALESVGMQGIAVPLQLPLGAGAMQQVVAKLDAEVNLLAGSSRGIHMSRLYRQVGEVLAVEPLTRDSLHGLLLGFLDSHAGLAERARVRIRFDVLLERPALLSNGSGWHAYPVEVRAELARGESACRIELLSSVRYSSTCPASAALARQAIQQAFAEHFATRKEVPLADAVTWLGSEAGVPATPHSQRSQARVKVLLQADCGLPICGIIKRIEQAVATPVQTAVKREDEQEFARLNARNTMFCEDAARRMHQALDGDGRFADFHIRASHFESLHAHDAVAVAVKGVAGGYCNADS